MNEREKKDLITHALESIISAAADGSTVSIFLDADDEVIVIGATPECEHQIIICRDGSWAMRDQAYNIRAGGW